MADDQLDAIVVGAGVAGSTAAYLLAKAGLEVALIERGPYPGSKNLSGGVLYGRVLHEIIPDYWQEAPVERYITNQVVTFLNADSSFHLDFKTQAFGEPPYNGFTVLRAKFDRWLADKAEQAGAMLVTGIKVERLLKEDGRVVGVVAGEEEMRARVVIVAEGVAGFLATEAGLRERVQPKQVAIGVKELIGLPREVIEERFHLAGDEGAAYSIVGAATGSIPGGGFLYTNKDSLSIGLVILLEDLLKSGRRPTDLLEDFLAHPGIAPLVRGGKLLEYGAHLVAEGGVENMPRLYGDGALLVGDTAGLSINTGFVVRGMDLAIGSAAMAAQAVLEARSQDDYSAAGLSVYKRLMDRSYVMADMRTYARTPDFFENERLYSGYPDWLADLFTRIYAHQGVPKERLVSMIRMSLNERGISIADLARDGWIGGRAL